MMMEICVEAELESEKISNDEHMRQKLVFFFAILEHQHLVLIQSLTETPGETINKVELEHQLSCDPKYPRNDRVGLSNSRFPRR